MWLCMLYAFSVSSGLLGIKHDIHLHPIELAFPFMCVMVIDRRL